MLAGCRARDQVSGCGHIGDNHADRRVLRGVPDLKSIGDSRRVGHRFLQKTNDVSAGAGHIAGRTDDDFVGGGCNQTHRERQAAVDGQVGQIQRRAVGVAQLQVAVGTAAG